MRSNKVMSFILGVFVISGTLGAFSAERSRRWAGLLFWDMHRKVAKDILRSLSGSGLTKTQIKRIADYSNLTDIVERSGHPYSHRVKKYKDIFDTYLDPANRSNAIGGTETAAVDHLESARNCFINGDDEWLMHLGRAIHYIVDSVCPAHVFPFQEGFGLIPPDLRAHTEFEKKMDEVYQKRNCAWHSMVMRAKPVVLDNLNDLPMLLEQAADEVFKFPCSYVRQDGERVNAQKVAFKGKRKSVAGKGTKGSPDFKMAFEDIGRSLEMGSSIAKGATQWVLR